uniref:Uncharacterized protein n=1 Tax=Glossina palpalis gambiensis TaxID=67801 RepID=A0A1B0BYY4_9MUSC
MLPCVGGNVHCVRPLNTIFDICNEVLVPSEPSSSGGGGGKAASVSPSVLASAAVSPSAAFVSPAAAGALTSCFAGSGSVAVVSVSSNPHGSSSSAISKYRFMQTCVIVIRNHFLRAIYLLRFLQLLYGFNNNKSSSSSSSLHLKLTVFFFGNIGAISSSKKCF